MKSDRETTTQADVGLGIVNISVGFACLRPAAWPAGILTLLVSAFVILALAGPAAAAQPLKVNSDAERWVLEQITSRQLADLQKQFPDEADRVLGAAFVEELLTGALTAASGARPSVRVAHAVVLGDVSLEAGHVPHEAWLDNCRFKGDFDLSGSRFEMGLSIEASVFEGSARFLGTTVAGHFNASGAQFAAEHEASFNSMKLMNRASFRKAIFPGPVDFSGLTVADSLDANEAQFPGEEQHVSFYMMRTGSDASFYKAVFAGPTSFANAAIGGDFLADEAHFERTASFNRMAVRSDAFFRATLFSGPVDSAGLDVEGALDAGGVQFRNEDQGVSFYALRTGSRASFARAVFAGPIDFTTADIGGNFEANDSRFNKSATFELMKVAADTSFHASHFDGPVKFNRMQLAGNFQASGARFKQLSNFDQLSVGNEMNLFTSEFSDSALFRGATIHGDFMASSAKFTAEEREANFSRLSVGGNVVLADAEFAGSVDFGSARIGDQLNAERAHFTNGERGVNFNGVRVGSLAFFDEAEFAGPLDFVGAQIGHQLVVRKAKFGESATADFGEVKVNGVASFADSEFGAQVTFIKTEAHSFDASRARFRKGASFNTLSVADSAFFDEAVFDGSFEFGFLNTGRNLSLEKARFNGPGPVDFGSSQIGLNLMANGTRFARTSQPSFLKTAIGGSALLSDAVFEGPATFLYAEVGEEFQATGAQFEQDTSFNSLIVRGNVFLSDCDFAGPLDFSHAEIGGNLEMDRTRFQRDVDLSRIKVGRSLSLADAAPGSNVTISDATLVDLFISGAGSSDSTLTSLDLSRSTVDGDLLIENVALTSLVASSLRVARAARLRDLTIGFADLEQSHLANVTMSSVSWPTDPYLVLLHGLTYERISADGGEDSWEVLLAWVNHAEYSSSIYTTLEAFFIRQGHAERANRVYVARKRRERAEQLSGFAWFWDLCLDLLVRYGRSPSRAFAWGALVVGVGSCVFRKDGMEPRKPEDAGRTYNAFWFSLDLFLPFVDLQSASVWKSKRDRGFQRHYMRLHVMVGWILIPVGLAAMTGIIK